jgi:hypothetical protein
MLGTRKKYYNCKYFTTASEVSRPKNLAKAPLFKENYLPVREDTSQYSVTTKAPI